MYKKCAIYKKCTIYEVCYLYCIPFQNYTTSMKFVKSFEELCGTRASVKALRTHPSLNTFMSKWSLPVYFQIRYSCAINRLEFGSSSDAIPSYRTETVVINTHNCNIKLYTKLGNRLMCFKDFYLVQIHAFIPSFFLH